MFDVMVKTIIVSLKEGLRAQRGIVVEIMTMQINYPVRWSTRIDRQGCAEMGKHYPLSRPASTTYGKTAWEKSKLVSTTKSLIAVARGGQYKRRQRQRTF